MSIAIIGAGPAGLMAAIQAARKKEVLLIEANSSAGKKLLISGSGQCNFSHSGDVQDFLTHYGRQDKFLKPALHAFSPSDTRKFFEEHGLKTKLREDGKYFPADGRARSVLEVLLQALPPGVSRLFSTHITSIEKESSGFLLRSAKKKYTADCVILAGGGKSYPTTGSNGSAYLLAQGLGHGLVAPRPSLCDVEIADFGIKECSGLSFKDLGLEIWRDGRLLQRCRGDLLITERGFSGPVILDNSRYMNHGDLLVPDFSMQGDRLESLLLSFCTDSGTRQILGCLREQGIAERLLLTLTAAAGLDPRQRWADLNKHNRKKLCALLQKTAYTIASCGNFTRAMCTAGGIPLKEVDPRSMQSRICPGLYFAGEILDIDGDCGGYNIQAAFSTGYLAGRSAVN